MTFFKTAQQVTICFGYFCKKIGRQDHVKKSPNLVPLFTTTSAADSIVNKNKLGNVFLLNLNFTSWTGAGLATTFCRRFITFEIFFSNYNRRLFVDLIENANKRVFLKNGPTPSTFCLFSFFSNKNFTEKTVGFSGIQTRIIREVGEHADYLTITTAPKQICLNTKKWQMN